MERRKEKRKREFCVEREKKKGKKKKTKNFSPSTNHRDALLQRVSGHQLRRRVGVGVAGGCGSRRRRSCCCCGSGGSSLDCGGGSGSRGGSGSGGRGLAARSRCCCFCLRLGLLRLLGGGLYFFMLVESEVGRELRKTKKNGGREGPAKEKKRAANRYNKTLLPWSSAPGSSCRQSRRRPGCRHP